MRLIAATAVLISAISPFSTNGREAAYLSGTTTTVKVNAVGEFATTSATDLVFASPQGSLSIPYDAIDKFEYRNEMRHKLGVAPMIAVGLIAKRQRIHYFTITYHDVKGISQVAVFEVSRKAPNEMLPIMRARVRKCAFAAGCDAKEAASTGSSRPGASMMTWTPPPAH